MCKVLCLKLFKQEKYLVIKPNSAISPQFKPNDLSRTFGFPKGQSMEPPDSDPSKRLLVTAFKCRLGMCSVHISPTCTVLEADYTFCHIFF